MVIVILGILAAVAIPRMTSLSDFHALAFRDSVVSILRYAQKTATSHRRLVCATFSPAALDLTIANANPAAACDTILRLSTGEAGLASVSANFSPEPADLFFQPDGRITTDAGGGAVYSGSLTVSGQTPIVVQGATGYVQ